jgi:catechol 2,3-dioxygenase-like lactoylglutathione lyase family enzyme
MVRHFEHVTIAVRDVDAAKRFFALLGFEEEISTVIKGPTMDAYMGIPGIEAEHVTLVLKGSAPRLEVQLLRYRQPSIPDEPRLARLDRLGFNHVCFAVDDLVAEVARLEAAGVKRRNEIMDFHGRKLVFLAGPEGVVIELSERH